ncbi:LytTR family DNA-binding domain-containing protein [soil metagenome]
MRVLIIEDEKPAADRLASLLRQLDPQVEVTGVIPAVKKAVQVLTELKGWPDLIFMDIHLADGLSFDIFELTEVKSPVIFTTAYDAYALRAFKVNSIDYLLKPTDADELEAALRKFWNLRAAPAPPAPLPDLTQMAQAVQMLQGQPYKTRFVVKVGEHLRPVAVEAIDFFFSFEKATFMQTREGKRYVVDYTLEQLEQLVDPRQFFRINRGYLVHLPAIQDIISYTNSRLKTILRHHPASEDVVVSREKVQAFKEWLDR